jgi:glutamyl-tRNA synthetase
MVKVRFAPSPTGHMHLGNARIAIVNYLFALKNGGHFVLRIDDTDEIRSKKEYEDSIIADLKWLRIHHDSTFRQSERTARYEEIKKELIARGVVYKCYEAPEELDYKRKIAITRGMPPVYDRASLNLSDEKKAKLDAEMVPTYWRFMLPSKTISWDDVVFGHISYDLGSISDPVIQKADGTYLYAFSSLIDDFDTGITHIIRGQDHITNTAVQIAMVNEIYGTDQIPFKFAHLSLLVNSNGAKFSKRLDSMNLMDLRSNGIDCMAISSMMATIGSALDVVPMTSMRDLVSYFDITKFSSNSPKFDINDLSKLNKKVLHKYSYEEITKNENITIDRKVFDLVHNNIERISDLHVWEKIFSPEFACLCEINDSDRTVLKAAIDILEKAPIETWIESIKSRTGIDGQALYRPIRMAMTGMEHGPNITDIATVMGTDKTRNRLLKLLVGNQETRNDNRALSKPGTFSGFE